MYKILLCLALLCPVLCPAGTVSDQPGTPIGDLDLLDLGINPDFFLFTGNTMYDYNGIYQLDIIAAGIDPSSVTSLGGLTIEQVLIILGDTGSPWDLDVTTPDGTTTVVSTSQSPVAPEPETVGLGVVGALTLLACKRGMKLKKSGNG